MSDIDTPESSNRWGGLIDLRAQQIVQIALLGITLGAVMWLATQLVRQVVLVPLFCGDPTNGMCLSATDTAGVIATVVAAVVGLMGLVRLSVYRPLLIVIASAVCLWGLSGWTAGLPWFEALAWTVILYAICYIAFAWLVRPRAFVPVVIIVVIVVALARLLPVLYN